MPGRSLHQREGPDKAQCGRVWEQEETRWRQLRPYYDESESLVSEVGFEDATRHLSTIAA